MNKSPLQPNEMKIAVIGAGGVGGYFGGKLAQAGHPVTFVARGEHFKAIRENGLKVLSISGDFVIDKVSVTDEMINAGTADLVLLAVKAWQVKEAAREIKGIADERTTVLPLQNGVLAAQELAAHLDKRNIVGGLCRIISKIEAPGVIRHFGVEPFIAFGELDNQKTDRTARIKEVFDRAGIACQVAEDIHVELWNKFMAICVSGLLAITRSTYGTVRALKETRKMMSDLLGEIHEIALRSGIRLDDTAVEKAMRLIDSYPCESTSSLTRDVMEGRPSEIDYQNGTVVRLAEEYNIDVPVNRFIYNCILPMELAARAKKRINGL
jgi:2-dehydropantoate 2-reductase